MDLKGLKNESELKIDHCLLRIFISIPILFIFSFLFHGRIPSALLRITRADLPSQHVLHPELP